MARAIMLTEDEVQRMERQRALQERAQRATDPNALYNQRMKAAHEAAMERRRGRILANPSAEADTTLRHRVLREEESRLAREHEMDRVGRELATREEEARQRAQGMENQGLGAARVRAEADRDIAGRNLTDKDLQRKHELEMLGRTQTFQGTQAEAERRNRLAIADVQGKSAVATAREQAAARAAELAGRNDVEREKIEARRRAVDQRAQTEANKELGRSFRALFAQRDPAGRSSLSDEEKATLEQLLKKMGL